MSYVNKRNFKKERNMHTLRTSSLTRKIRQQSAVDKIWLDSSHMVLNLKTCISKRDPSSTASVTWITLKMNIWALMIMCHHWLKLSRHLFQYKFNKIMNSIQTLLMIKSQLLKLRPLKVKYRRRPWYSFRKSRLTRQLLSQLKFQPLRNNSAHVLEINAQISIAYALFEE